MDNTFLGECWTLILFAISQKHGHQNLWLDGYEANTSAISGLTIFCCNYSKCSKFIENKYLYNQ